MGRQNDQRFRRASNSDILFENVHMRWCSTCNLHSHLARIPANCETENGYVAAVQRRDGEDDWAGDDSSSSMGNQFLTIELKPGEVYWEKTVLDGGRQQELWPLSWQWLYWRVSQVLFHAYIARWTSWGSKTVESPSNSTFNKLGIPIWEAWCTILSPGGSGTRKYMVDVDLDELDLA